MLTRRDLVHVWSLIAVLIMLAFNAGWRAGSGAWPPWDRATVLLCGALILLVWWPARKVDR